MTSPTGTKPRSQGFTLIEVLITVAVLALATVFISQSNLLSGAVYGRYMNRLSIQDWAQQKIWEVKEGLLAEEFPDTSGGQGAVSRGTRTYRWNLDIEEEKEKLTSLYTIHLDISWSEGGQDVHLERFGGLMKTKDK